MFDLVKNFDLVQNFIGYCYNPNYASFKNLIRAKTNLFDNKNILHFRLSFPGYVDVAENYMAKYDMLILLVIYHGIETFRF